MPQYHMLVNGNFIDGVREIDVINPATGDAFAKCPVADKTILDHAVSAAKKAFPAWSAHSVSERAALVDRIADALEARLDEFARVLTAEQGKPLDQAAYEIAGSVYVLRAFAQMELSPRTIRDGDAGHVIEVRSPLGVVAMITPWNFPVVLLMNKMGPALVAGNTVVAKPAPTTPLTTLMFGALCNEILPAGVVNVICDANDLGGALTAHPDIAKVAFTGSTATGKKVMASAAEGVKRVTLELGGNDAAIVLDDVDVAQAAQSVFDGSMINAGQVCVAIKRAYVPAAIYDPFCDELARLASEAIVDDGEKQGAQIGPVQNKAQYEKLKDLLLDAHETGRVIAGGHALDRPGYFIAPTIVRDIPHDARLVREEQFGPVLPVVSYDTIEDAIAKANDSEYGLAGTVWGKDVSLATQVATRIHSGTVWVNQHMAIDPALPFRGAKQSGFGGELGLEGLHEYTQATIVNVAA